MERFKLKPQTYEESVEESRKANERARILYEHYKDINPKFAKMVIENIDLMPPDSIVVNTKTTNELKEDIQEEI